MPGKQLLSLKYCDWRIGTANLYDKKDDGILGVITRGITAFEDTSLGGCSECAARSRTGGYGLCHHLRHCRGRHFVVFLSTGNENKGVVNSLVALGYEEDNATARVGLQDKFKKVGARQRKKFPRRDFVTVKSRNLSEIVPVSLQMLLFGKRVDQDFRGQSQSFEDIRPKNLLLLMPDESKVTKIKGFIKGRS